MKYALLNGKKTHIKNAVRGTLAKDSWFNQYDVLACKGHYMAYWRYLGERPVLPEGYENETEWHATWKSLIHDEHCEVICGDNKEHRADIFTNEYIIEIQNSPISFDAVKDRVDFYRQLTNERVIWIINAYSVSKNIIVGKAKPYDKVIWKYQKKWVVDICGWKSTEVLLDLSPKYKSLLKIWVHDGDLYGCWMSKQRFYEKYLKACSEETEDFASIFYHLNSSDY